MVYLCRVRLLTTRIFARGCEKAPESEGLKNPSIPPLYTPPQRFGAVYDHVEGY
jgi:hypothetical protein